MLSHPSEVLFYLWTFSSSTLSALLFDKKKYSEEVFYLLGKCFVVWFGLVFFNLHVTVF